MNRRGFIKLAGGVAVVLASGAAIVSAIAANVHAEAGFPDLIIEDWFGILVKSGTANDVVLRLNEAFNKALAKPRVREAIEKLAAVPAGGTPAEFGQFLTAQITHWGKVVKDSGIKMHQ